MPCKDDGTSNVMLEVFFFFLFILIVCSETVTGQSGSATVIILFSEIMKYFPTSYCAIFSVLSKQSKVWHDETKLLINFFDSNNLPKNLCPSF